MKCPRIIASCFILVYLPALLLAYVDTYIHICTGAHMECSLHRTVECGKYRVGLVKGLEMLSVRFLE